MISIIVFLAVAGMIASIMTLIGRCPAGVASLLLSIAIILMIYPNR